YWSARLFFGLFLLNLSSLVINLEGQQLVRESKGGDSFVTALYTWHTLGNTAVDGVLAKGGLSYGVTEFFSAGILVGYL